MLNIWPYNNIYQIQDYLFIISQVPPTSMKLERKRSETNNIANHLDQSIYVANQE
jgi:hypothetical protein